MSPILVNTDDRDDGNLNVSDDVEDMQLCVADNMLDTNSGIVKATGINNMVLNFAQELN